tara:strand:- start:1815 stop:3131 length:1317 start_codon:yes stop_codon:yes gene_type:complete
MEQNYGNVNDMNYISVENLELLYSNIRNYFFDIHKLDILNYNANIKKILFENMKLIYDTKYAPSLKTKELNIITLKNLKEILENEIKKSNVKQDNNVDIISRENNIYDRRNEDNKVLMPSSNTGTFNMEQNKNFSNDYDQLLSARNSSIPKKREVNFNTEVIDSVSSEALTKNMETLLAERESFVKDINNTKDTNKQTKIINKEKNKEINTKIKDKNNYNNSNNNNELPNLEGFSMEDDNYGTLFNQDGSQNENQQHNIDDLNNFKTDNNIENVDINNFQYLPEQQEQQELQEQQEQQEPLVEIKRQIIVISSSKRDLEKYPNPYQYTIELKVPIENIISIKLLNVLINISKVRNNINYLILDINNLNLLTSNNDNINNQFALVFENKIYNEQINFNEPLEKLDKFEISLKDKNNNIPELKDNSKKNENVLEFLIEYF